MLNLVSIAYDRQGQTVVLQNEDEVGEEKRLVKYRPDEPETRDGQHGEARKANDARVDEKGANVVLGRRSGRSAHATPYGLTRLLL